MPNESVAVTGSVRSSTKLFVYSFVLLLAIGTTGLGLHRTATAPTLNTPTLRIKDRTFEARIARTDAERQQGLSGTASLEIDEAMIFIFDGTTRPCFWMKDMRYSLDILWFDADRKLIYEQRDLNPQTYPASYCPPSDTAYVVEVPAGTATSVGLQTGDKLGFNQSFSISD